MYTIYEMTAVVNEHAYEELEIKYQKLENAHEKEIEYVDSLVKDN